MKYNKGQIVEIKDTSKIVTIIDFEVFDNLTLYYTDDKSAYPEDNINPEGYSFLKTILLKSDEEKNNLFLSVLEKHGGDVIFE